MKKPSHWITLPDDQGEKAFRPSLMARVKSGFLRAKNRLARISSDAPSAAASEVAGEDKVTNKWFWGVSFVVLGIFSVLLFAPQQLADLLRGDLFGNYLEDYEGLPILPTESEPEPVDEFGDSASSAQSSSSNDGLVVDAQTTPVDIQVDPIQADPAESDPAQSGEGMEGVQESEPADSAGEESVSGDQNPVPTEPLPTEVSDPNSKLLQDLAQQLDALKQKDQQNQELIQQLSSLSQQGGVYSAASPEAAAANDLLGQPESPSAQPDGSVAPTSGTGAFAPGTSAPSTVTPTSGSGSTTYRLNPYRVTMTPQQVLAMNQGKYQQALQQYNAGQIPATGANVVGSQNNYSFSGVPATPASGPGQVALILALLAGFGFVGWRGASRSRNF